MPKSEQEPPVTEAFKVIKGVAMIVLASLLSFPYIQSAMKSFPLKLRPEAS